MGLGRTDLLAVAALRRSGHFAGARSVVEIGAQQMAGALFDDPRWIAECSAAFDLEPRSFEGPGRTGEIVHGEQVGQSRDAPLSRPVWEWLGFEYSSIDVDGSPGAIPLDLNFAATPGYMHGKATLVANCGTTEHIANQLNAFKVIHELTEVGGVMLHNVPAQGYLTHGLINYNPKFFWSLSAANGYKWLASDLRQSPFFYPTPDNVVGEIRKFDPQADERAAKYRFADAALLVVLQKLYDIPFVPPIDVKTGSKTEIEELRQRYWTVFERERFDAYIAEVERQRRG